MVVSSILRDGVSLLEALEEELSSKGPSWVPDCATALFRVAAQLRQSAGAAKGVESEKIERLVAVTQAPATGRRGRPRKQFNEELIRDALSAHRNISISVLADAFKVHPNTLRKYLKLHGLYQQFSHITDIEIDRLIRSFQKAHPKSGIRYAIGFLKRNNIRVPKRRVMASLKRVNPVAQRLHTWVSITRREYRVAQPNALWHMDGHHKLIRWGIVIHGFVDGYSQKVMALQANTDNTANTVLDLFLGAVDKSGFPWRVRGDRGSKNIEVSVCMILFWGLNRGSFIWGTSTRNTRIERLWVEVGTQFARAWRAFFTRLERIHRLNCQMQGHLWLLHRLFLAEVNDDCASFKLNWNNHPVSRAGHDQSPEDMFFLGQLRYGKYPEPSEPHPTVREEYGVSPNVHRKIGNDLAQHVHHDAVAVPVSRSPFTLDEANKVFNEALEQALQTSVVPKGFDLLQDEWGGAEYPTSERVKVARKEVDIPLPFDIWYPWAVSCGCPVRSPGGLAIPVPAQEGSRKKVVRKILETFALDKPLLSSAATSVNKQTDRAAAARAETNAGFRPKQHGGTHPKASGSSSLKSQKGGAKSGQTSKVGAVVLILCGVKYHKGKGDLRKQRAPSPKTLEEFREFGLVVDDVDNNPPEFHWDWSHSDIDAWLRSLFPKAFQYLDRFGSLPNGDYHWKLASKQYQTLFLHDCAKLSGADLFNIRSSSARSYHEHQLQIVIVWAIPREVYSDWMKALSKPISSKPDVITVKDSDDDTAKSKVPEVENVDQHEDTDPDNSDGLPTTCRSCRLCKRCTSPVSKSSSPATSPPPAQRVSKGKARRLSFTESESENGLSDSDGGKAPPSPRSTLNHTSRSPQKRKRALSVSSTKDSPNENNAEFDCHKRTKRHKGWVSQYTWQPPNNRNLRSSPQPPSSPVQALKMLDDAASSHAGMSG